MENAALFETLAGTGATMVAIIGGFALSKWLTISNEVTALDRSIAELEREAGVGDPTASMREYSEEFELVLEAALQPKIVDSVLIAIANGDGTDRIMSEFETRIFPELRGSFAVTTVAGQLADEARRARGHPWFDTIGKASSHPHWHSARAEAPSDRRFEMVWERQYVKVCGRRQQEFQPVEYTLNGGLPRWSTSPGMPPVSGSSRDALVRRVLENQASRAQLNADLRRARDRRQLVTPPSDIGRSVTVLMASFILTVAPSIVVLAAQPSELHDAALAAVLESYLAGMILLFTYIGWIANEARRGH